MMSPKRVKWRKQQKGRMNGLAYAGSDVSFGDFGLATTESGWISSRQIEAARVALTRHVKRGGRIWIRIFPDKPVTKKPAETRMGTGKGGVEGWIAVVRPGRSKSSTKPSHRTSRASCKASSASAASSTS